MTSPIISTASVDASNAALAADVRAYTQALLVDRAALLQQQEDNDALSATRTLKRAYTTDVAPLLAMLRLERGGAIDPIAAYRADGYRARMGALRPAVRSGGGGIV